MRRIILAFAAVFAFQSSPAFAEIKVNGATTVTFGLMKPTRND